jgi:hypothetical protein
MHKFDITKLQGSNIQFLITTLPENLFKEVQKQVFNMGKRVDHQHKLAGHIKEEYDFLVSNNLKSYLLDMALEYIGLNNNENIDTSDVSLQQWINFQRKYEFNPIHNHTGLVSYVIWVKIPFTNEKEHKMFPKLKVNDYNSGKFVFVYPNNLDPLSVMTYGIPADKRFEGHILMFPSTLQHMVYPFYTSNEYRISIAGNLISPNLTNSYIEKMYREQFGNNELPNDIKEILNKTVDVMQLPNSMEE